MMLKADTEFHMAEEFYSDSINVWIIQKTPDGREFVGEIVFKELEKGMLRQPTLKVPMESQLPENMKQALKAMGRLHFADEATLKAKDAHLEDMRTLVFKGDKP